MIRVEILDPYYRGRAEMKEWCRKNIGLAQTDTGLLWMSRCGTKRMEKQHPAGGVIIEHFTAFYFRNKRDATLFLLRWS